MKLKIDDEFRKLIPPLKPEERAQLEENLIKEGCRDPLVIWNETILDGHNRYEICTRRDILYSIEAVDLPDREAAMDWIDRNQVGRRNLSEDNFRLILGRIYNRTKKAQGGTGANQYKQSVPNEHIAATKERTAVTLAKEYGVSESTVRRAGKLAEAVEQVEKEMPELAEKGRDAVIEKAKEKTSRQNEKPKPKEVQPEPKQEVKAEPKTSWALEYAEMAISQLERINENDPKRVEALNRVTSWINNQLNR